MYINFKCALTKAILFVFFAQIILFNHVAYAQTAGELQIKQPKFESNVLPEANTDFQINKPQFNKNQTDFSQPEFEIVKPELRNPEIKNPELKEPEVRESEENSEKEKKLYYIGLMRRVADLRKGEVENIKEEKELLAKDLEKFIEMEKENLEKLRIDDKKRQAYFDLLQKQIKNVEAVTPETIEEEKEKQKREAIKENRPENPSSFDFNDQKVKIDSINIEESKKLSYNDHFGESLNIKTAYAMDTQYMPVLEDIQESDEVVLSADIKALSDELNRNPVNILNYVHNNIDYEPYYGAKKGSEGCLREKICNDTDAASLTIALMRASGIPARYKKGVAVMSVEQLQELLAVDETKTVYYALYVNKVPVYTLGGTQVGQNIDAADFSGETHLAVEWTYPEIFYDYDEKGGNVPNQTKLEEIQTTQELRDLYTNEYNKNWIPVDGITKRYSRTQNTIVHDTVNFDTETFWYDYLQYQGALSPLEKYVQDIQNQSGNDITDPQFQSTKEIIQSEFDILPPSRPYGFASGVTNGGDPINIETWSQLPDDRRFKVEIKLLRDSDHSEVLSNTFFGNEINNKEVEIIYKGATPADQSTIDSYGGIHLTPASLVDIKPVFLTKDGRIENSNSVSIGEKLVLEFNYYIKGNVISTNQKFSVAGNFEGIYLVLSKLQDEDIYNDGVLDNEEILYSGNAKIAWKFIRRIEKENELLKKTFDYSNNADFLRAVITQNRVLSEVGGVPTTFDYTGLTIDSSYRINDYSNRGNFKNHNSDFRLLLGLIGSHYEAELFNELSNVEAISTVEGLQYAYANPSEYTVHVIDSGNQSIINNLNLSSNTKQNMLADVQAGNTIITPDKPVTQGVFSGILYISLDPNKTGNYAIGEQNGGYEVEDWTPYDEIYKTNVSGVPASYYMDRPTLSGMSCNPSTNMETTIQDIMDNDLNVSGKLIAGAPCFMGTTDVFGSKRYSYVLTTNAIKFLDSPANNWNDYYGPGYWVPIDLTSPIVSIQIGKSLNAITYGIDNYIQVHKNLTDTHLNFLPSGERYTLRFSLKLGTIRQHICEEQGIINCKDYATIYYVPDNTPGDFGEIHRVREQYLSKLDENNNEYFEKLGLPHGDEDLAASSANIHNGTTYQVFENGNIYQFYAYGFIWTYYTYGELKNTHNSWGGTGGILGFPQGDPVEGHNFVQQKFEDDKSIEWDLNTNTTAIAEYKKHKCELYGVDPGPKKLIGGIFLEGLLDAGIATLDSLGSFIFSIGESIYKTVFKFGEVKQDVIDLYNKLLNTDIDDVLSMLIEIGGHTYQSLVDEYNTSIGPNGCHERASYLKGVIFGELLMLIVPASELAKTRLVTKVDTFNAISKGKKGFSAITYITKSRLGENVLELFSGKTKYFDDWVKKSLKNSDWKPTAHHIVPQHFRTDPNYSNLINRLDQIWGGPGKFDLDEGINGVILPSKLHVGGHLGSYKNRIYNELNYEIVNGAGKDEIIEKIRELRIEILDGDLPINNNWADTQYQVMKDSVKNSKHVYD
jgi:transglutaminase-like putative cysteine protease